VPYLGLFTRAWPATDNKLGLSWEPAQRRFRNFRCFSLYWDSLLCACCLQTRKWLHADSLAAQGQCLQAYVVAVSVLRLSNGFRVPRTHAACFRAAEPAPTNSVILGGRVAVFPTRLCQAWCICRRTRVHHRQFPAFETSVQVPVNVQGRGVVWPLPGWLITWPYLHTAAASDCQANTGAKTHLHDYCRSVKHLQTVLHRD
jgi:hypothetical protein